MRTLLIYLSLFFLSIASIHAQSMKKMAQKTEFESRLAKEAQPKEMWLTHYSPSLTRPEEFMDRVREIFPGAKAARDGWSAELGFEETP